MYEQLPVIEGVFVKEYLIRKRELHVGDSSVDTPCVGCHWYQLREYSHNILGSGSISESCVHILIGSTYAHNNIVVGVVGSSFDKRQFLGAIL